MPKRKTTKPDKVTFPCGCEFPVDTSLPDVHGHPAIVYRVEDAPLTCEATWDLISSGRTKGIFQLESSLGKTWARRLKPRNIGHLAALVSLLRPGCLRAKDERGVSMTELYCRRKNGEEPVKTDVEAVRHILEPTYDIVVFQEQFMQISQVVAGFNLVEVDRLRKAAGKKDPKAMTEVGDLFVEKADKLGVITRGEAERLFANIEKSARYSFNRCTSFDTKILRPNVSRFSSKAHFTVEEMYRIRHDAAYAKATDHESLRRKWKMLGNYGKGLSLCEDGRIRPNVIEDIRPAGFRKVYGITLDNGATIRVTGNHKFPTDEGVMTVEEMLGFRRDGITQLFREVKLYCCGAYEQSDFAKLGRFSDASRADRAAATGRSGKGTGGEGNRWFTNDSFTKFKEFRKITPDVCFDCGRRGCRIETHHINGDRSNSNPENLIKLCSSCHKKREYASGRTRRGEEGYPAILRSIISIVLDGECMTYDVTMRAPSHTFTVESGIVTCNSHAVSYAFDSYYTAHEKAHFPVYFFTSYLYFAKDKMKPLQEIRELVDEAKLFDVRVLPPRFSDLEKHFANNGVEIAFGLANVKDVGERKVDKMIAAIPHAEAAIGKDRVVWTWFDFLVYFSEHVDSVAIRRMIEVGALRDFGTDRLRLLAEHDAWRQLRKGEREKVAELRDPIVRQVREDSLDDFLSYNPQAEVADQARDDGCVAVIVDPERPVANLADAIEQLLLRSYGNTKPTKHSPSHPRHAIADEGRRKQVESIRRLLLNPPTPLADKPYWIAKKEEEVLGVPLTCTHVDAADRSRVNATCKDVRDGKDRGGMSLAVEVRGIREIVVRNGKNSGKTMAYLTVADETGSLDDVTVFSDAWEKYGHLLAREKAVVGIRGSRDRNRGGFVVDEVWEI